MTTWLAVAAIALAAASVVLFVLALRRLLSRQAEVTETLLRRYDDRLAGFAQTLNDALAAYRMSRPVATLELEDDPEPMVRALEMARERTSADGAIALVTSGKGTPIVATVGLSESETNHIARMGFPDYRGARAIEVAFAGDLPAPEGEDPVRSGLVMPLLAEDEAQSLLGVLTRDRARRFSEEDVDGLETLVQTARPPISRALDLREADVVPEVDMLTNLLDRQSFPTILEREILRARLAHHPLTLLVLDVDRLTWLNARIGILAADGVLLEVAQRLRGAAHRLDYAFRLGGGRFAIVRPGSEGGDASSLFEAVQTDLEGRPVGDAGTVSVSGGIAELEPQDGTDSLVARADAALAEAKRVRRGSVVYSGRGGASHERANGTLRQIAPGEIVLEG
jgi:diguanylate cyclase (GGDEF)-like protein